MGSVDESIISEFCNSLISDLLHYNDICKEYCDYLVQKTQANANNSQNPASPMNSPALPMKWKNRSPRSICNACIAVFLFNHEGAIPSPLCAEYLGSPLFVVFPADALTTACTMDVVYEPNCPVFLSEYSQSSLHLVKILVKELVATNRYTNNPHANAILKNVVRFSSLIMGDGVPAFSPPNPQLGAREDELACLSRLSRFRPPPNFLPYIPYFSNFFALLSDEAFVTQKLSEDAYDFYCYVVSSNMDRIQPDTYYAIVVSVGQMLRRWEMLSTLLIKGIDLLRLIATSIVALLDRGTTRFFRTVCSAR